MTEFIYLKRFTFPWGLSIRCEVVGNVESYTHSIPFQSEQRYNEHLPKFIPWRKPT